MTAGPGELQVDPALLGAAQVHDEIEDRLHQAVLLVQRSARLLALLGSEQPPYDLDLRAERLAGAAAGSKQGGRVVTQTLGLAGVARRHNVDFVALQREPDRRDDVLAVFAKRREVGVLVA